MLCSQIFLGFILNPKVPKFFRISRGWSSSRQQGLGFAGGASPGFPLQFEGHRSCPCNEAFAVARGAGGGCAQCREEERGVEMETEKWL